MADEWTARERELFGAGFALAARAPLATGDIVVEKYVVERVLGQGGMGIVLLARHIELERKVAIKVLREGVLADDSSTDRASTS